jgi:hypothetical protein
MVGGKQPAKRPRFAAAAEGVVVGDAQDVDMVSQVCDLGTVDEVGEGVDPVTSEDYKNLKLDNRGHEDWNPSHAARSVSVQAAQFNESAKDEYSNWDTDSDECGFSTDGEEHERILKQVNPGETVPWKALTGKDKFTSTRATTIANGEVYDSLRNKN